MLYLDATELIENPGMSLRRVAQFAGVPPLINEQNFYFDEEKGDFILSEADFIVCRIKMVTRK